jgi:transcriptional pleiotropic repressor
MKPGKFCRLLQHCRRSNEKAAFASGLFGELIKIVDTYILSQLNEGGNDMTNSQRVLNTLSWSEQKALKELFNRPIENNQLFIVASKIADSIGISRSVIVNMIGKLESGAMVESHSLGVKGTHIRVIDPGFLGAVKALEI